MRNPVSVALRNLYKDKGFAGLNLAGLTTGLTCAGLILLWVENELTFDGFHTNRDNIYQVLDVQTYGGTTSTLYGTPGPLKAALEMEMPEIRQLCRTDWGGRVLVSAGEKNTWEDCTSVEPEFFELFTFPLLKGNSRTVFSSLHSVVVTKSFSQKYFGSDDALGKVIRLDHTQDYTITGLVADPPENSTFRFSILRPFEVYRKANGWTDQWSSNGVQTFAGVTPGASLDQLHRALGNLAARHAAEKGSAYFLYAMRDWHLRSDFTDGKITGGRIEQVRLFSVIAVFILLIACINFINHATARAGQRSGDVGIRKILGARRSTLIRQFLGETIVLSSAAALLAAGAIWLLLPAFNELTGAHLTLRLTDPLQAGGLLAAGLITGVLAGAYPAYFLSAFRPENALRRYFSGGRGSMLRKTLVVGQFTVSIAITIGTLVVFQQIQYIKNKRLGFEKDQLVMVPLTGRLEQKFAVVKAELLAGGAIEDAALANQQLLLMGANASHFDWPGKPPQTTVVACADWVSPEYLHTTGIALKAGRDFGPSADANAHAVIINETFADLIGRNDLIGQTLTYENRPYTVIGVVENFRFNDLYKKPEPVALFASPTPKSYLFARLKAGHDPSEALRQLETVLKKHNPGYPVEYSFVDEPYERLFQRETMTGRLARLFAGLAIFISCLGLWGLITFVAAQRNKEIGIRKVLGASATGIVGLLSRDFLTLVLIALGIAIPTGYILMNRWLDNFADHISIGWTVFAASGGMALAVVFLTVGLRSVQAALAHPLLALRNE